VVDADFPLTAEHESPFDHILQFAHIAGPVVGHQERKRLRGDARNLLVLQIVEAADELPGQQGNILYAAAQRRQFNADDIDAVIEVFTESALAGLLCQIAVGGGQDAHIGALRAGGAERLIDAFLQHPQQADLQGRTHLADFVEKEGAAFGDGKSPQFVLVRSGESPSLVAEELRFQQGVGQGPAVDRDKGAFAARAEGVDGPRQQLLARAGLAKDENGAGTGGDGGQHFEEALHQGAVADQVTGAKTAIQFLAQRFQFAQVTEGLRSTDDAPIHIPQHGGRDADGDAFALGVDDIAGLANDGFAVFNRPPHGALALAHAAAEDLRTEPADGLLARGAGDLLGRPVERGDAPLPVDGEDPVGDAFENRLGGGDGYWNIICGSFFRHGPNDFNMVPFRCAERYRKMAAKSSSKADRPTGICRSLRWSA